MSLSLDTKKRDKTLSIVYTVTPESPIYSILDTWSSGEITTRTWDFPVPNDGMVYSLVDYCHACMPAAYIYGGIGLNGQWVYRYYTSYEAWHTWGKKNPFFARYPDLIQVQLANIYDFVTINHYWCLSFYRKPV